MGKVLMSGIVPPLEEPVSYKANFADNDWATIIDAVQKNKVPDTWVVGSQKSMMINGTSYIIDIIGKNHDTYSDGSGKAPLTFQLHDLYGTKYGMNSNKSNSNGWGNSEMRLTHMPSILSQMPTEVQAAIKEVDKKTTRGYSSNSPYVSQDKLFLLSTVEIFNAIGESGSGEGEQYAYYKAGNSAVKKHSGTAATWWTRSPRITSSTGYCSVSSSGTNAINGSSQNAQGVAFAFCF